MNQDKYLRVTFMRNGFVYVTNTKTDYKVVVGRAVQSNSGYWHFTYNTNSDYESSHVYYGKRRCDLVPFAKFAYNKIMREVA